MTPPPQLPAQQTPQLRPASNQGGCASGCIAVFVLAALGLALLIGVTWWGGTKVIADYTSPQGIPLGETPPSGEDYEIANAKFATLQDALLRQQPVTVELTGADVNALIARHPSFVGASGKCRVGIAESLVTLELSLPLDGINWPQVKDRWLNASMEVGLDFQEDQFAVSVRSMSANGRELPPAFVDAFSQSFTTRFSEKLVEARRENQFWGNMQALSVSNDRIVVTTKGPELEAGQPAPVPPARP